ncbi:MAG: hypothetical protein MUP24_11270 [Gillisia sp.]|nr:hypothetical protein [Gillisia sp.]
MKKVFFKILFFSLMISSFISCATFPKSTEYKYILNKENINSLNGKYSLKEINRSSLTDSSSFSFSKSDIGFNHTFFDEIDSRMLARSIEIDSSKSYCFILKVLNSKNIEIDYLENEKSIRQQTIKYKLKDDGYVYLKNRNFKIRGVPYLFGDFDVKKIRLTLNKDKNLLLETSEFTSGGVALLMIYPVGKMKYQKIYERKE